MAQNVIGIAGATSAEKTLLDDVAFHTALDPSLALLVSLRPNCSLALANQAVYVAKLVNAVKAKCIRLKSQAASVKSTNTALVATPLQVQVTVIGCGSVGSLVVDELLGCSTFHPTSISVVTRQPSSLSVIASKGVRCLKTVDDVMDTTDLFVIACQPGQFSHLAKSMKGRIRKASVCFSVCCGLPVEKIASELGHAGCLTASIDVDSMARWVTTWTREDEVAERIQRAAYAASKSHKPMAPSSVEIVDPEERSRRRRKQALENSFPAAVTDFFNRAAFVLGNLCMRRGIPLQESVHIAWSTMLDVNMNSITLGPHAASDVSGLVEVCNLRTIAHHLRKDPREVLVDFKDAFLNEISN